MALLHSRQYQLGAARGTTSGMVYSRDWQVGADWGLGTHWAWGTPVSSRWTIFGFPSILVAGLPERESQENTVETVVPFTVGLEVTEHHLGCILSVSQAPV